GRARLGSGRKASSARSARAFEGSRPRQRAATGGPGGIGGAQGAQRPSTARAPRRLCSFAAGADAHHADPRQPELSGESAVGPARGPPTAELIVAPRLDAAPPRPRGE